MLDIQYSERYDYGQLRRTLIGLNFQEHTGTNEFNAPIRVFYNREYDALITIPDKPDTTPLEPIYLRAAEKTVEDWGVAESDAFLKLLHQAAHKEAQVA